TTEVLQVINASPGKLQPVFDAILEKAHSVCGTSIGALWLYDGEMMRAVATRGMSQEAADRLREPRPPTPPQLTLTRHGQRFFQRIDQGSGLGDVNPEIAGASVRAILAVPLVKDGTAIGLISARREEARAFSDKEIGLLETFAAQAVIAMENARLLGEL